MQPKLFENTAEAVDLNEVVLYALGEFQSRGHKLAGRELAFDRLRGAFLRAASKFRLADIADSVIIQSLKDLGANVADLPGFVAKRPYRVTVGTHLADRSLAAFRDSADDR